MPLKIKNNFQPSVKLNLFCSLVDNLTLHLSPNWVVERTIWNKGEDLELSFKLEEFKIWRIFKGGFGEVLRKDLEGVQVREREEK